MEFQHRGKDNACHWISPQLIYDILDMSKIESGKLELVKESFDLTEMVAEINTIIFQRR